MVLVIETPPGLSEEQVAAAAEVGPPGVGAEASLEEMTRMSGFRVTRVEDVTPEFEATVLSVLEARRSSETELRAAEGDDEYEVERTKKEHMLEGIQGGLLRRTLVVAEKG